MTTHATPSMFVPASGDERIVADALIATLHTGASLSDMAARIIAGWWHAGQTSPFYAFVSTGAITTGFDTELRDALLLAAADLARHAPTSTTPAARAARLHYHALDALRAYYDTRPRGPVPHWHDRTRPTRPGGERR